jgi:hypothetical protein
MLKFLPCVCPSVCVFVSLLASSTECLSFYLFLHLSVYLSISSCICFPVSTSVCLSISTSLFQSVSLSFSLYLRLLLQRLWTTEVIMLSVVMLKVTFFRVVLSVIMLGVVTLSGTLFRIVLSEVILGVVMLSVSAPVYLLKRRPGPRPQGRSTAC